MLICGPSGCGKTNTLMHMLYHVLYYDKIYLYSKNLGQPKYPGLLDTFAPISRECGYDVVEASNDEILPLEELDDESQKVVVFDDRFINITHAGTQRQLRIGYGSGHEYITSFPPKASPVTFNFSVLFAHYNSVQVNDSLVYCNGKDVAHFEGESNTGSEDTFSIGSISSTPSSYNSQKQIAYFSLYHGRFNVKDIKIMHKYLCKRYKIVHDPITIP